jgi:hypothetical protein
MPELLEPNTLSHAPTEIPRAATDAHSEQAQIDSDETDQIQETDSARQAPQQHTQQKVDTTSTDKLKSDIPASERSNSGRVRDESDTATHTQQQQQQQQRVDISENAVGGPKPMPRRYR